jgi:general L-amino acid transport system substrate-binding protein
VLIRNTTWTMSRAEAGMFFTGVNFYDGQGFMVKKKLGVDSALGVRSDKAVRTQGGRNEILDLPK